MQAKRFEELKATGLLPSPTGIGLEILRLTRDDSVSAADIGRVIQADPALTGRTLRLANTGNAASGRAVASIADAVARLGTRTVGRDRPGIYRPRRQSQRQMSRLRLPAVLVAFARLHVATQILASHTRHKNAGDGFTAGLLAQIGRLALASIHTEQYSAVLADWGDGTPGELVRLEQHCFVTDHNELSGVMLADWGLPRAVCESAQYHENPSASGLDERSSGRELARIVHAASQIADVCVAPDDRQAAASAAELVAGCEAVGIDSQALAALFERVFAQWAEWGQLLEVPTQQLPNLAELIEAGRSFSAAASTETRRIAAADTECVDRIPRAVPGGRVAGSSTRWGTSHDCALFGQLRRIADPACGPRPRLTDVFGAIFGPVGASGACAGDARQALQSFSSRRRPSSSLMRPCPTLGGSNCAACVRRRRADSLT